ncbi:C-reactive protein [Suncus etruscus]|uniref:C-reactive protein n=1 Tax=Suncus etruscus TaxID=109475 RepID=UPI00211023BC|nr:C-reactive protein [Suncus etruscus]
MGQFMGQELQPLRRDILLQQYEDLPTGDNIVIFVIVLFARSMDSSSMSSTQQRVLLAFTLCLFFYTDLARNFTLFSGAIKYQPSSFVLQRFASGSLILTMGGYEEYFVPSASAPALMHICTTETWPQTLWSCGWIRCPWCAGLCRGFTSWNCKPSSCWQQKRTSDNLQSFDYKEAFVGDLGEVNMWFYVLKRYKIKCVFTESKSYLNTLAWEEFWYNILRTCIFSPSSS